MLGEEPVPTCELVPRRGATAFRLDESAAGCNRRRVGARIPSRIAWLVAVGCVAAVVFGVVWLGRSLRQPLGPGPSPAPDLQVLALTPEPVLPPTTPEWSPPGPDLTGRITSTNGEAIAGAVVLIDAAAPRVGRGFT
jgi:hypothetical protein